MSIKHNEIYEVKDTGGYTRYLWGRNRAGVRRDMRKITYDKVISVTKVGIRNGKFTK